MAAKDTLGFRRRTREVRVGNVGVGGANPIRVQSMTTTDTQDAAATADQAERLAAAGCEIVRITAPSIRDAESLGEIAALLRARRVDVPLVADIHFTPNAAMIAAEHVEKVRVNPGNYADKKRFEVREYTDAEYRDEVERVGDRFRPLVRRLKELGRGLRIGTNHGSLSDRILNRYGDTPRGMVESAIEFLDVCESESFYDVVFSMKASNPQVAIQAYRALVERLEERAPGEPSYPIHLGVTEAGDGEDGRIKSAIGIGSLLEDGIGDTIRVSLTEDPVKEVPVAQALARLASARWELDAGRGVTPLAASEVVAPTTYTRRATAAAAIGELEFGGTHAVRVELDLGPVPEAPETLAAQVATQLALLPDELPCEALRLEAADATALQRTAVFRKACHELSLALPLTLEVPPAQAAAAATQAERVAVRLTSTDSLADLDATGVANLEWALSGWPDEIPALVDRALAAESAAAPTWSLHSPRLPHAVRALAAQLAARGAEDGPVTLRAFATPETDAETSVLAAAVDLGAPLCDGLGDAVSLRGFENLGTAVDRAYRILQGARLRTVRTEFISCPSCGRTLFDLEETTARIKARTEHLPGVKIAVMGCIVNGPGEMADADFGYVGSGPGRVNLYVGKEVVVRAVAEDEAPDRLVDLIRDHNRWVDP
ncbi:MAG: (E)-4-hydroxy-3-methylbut-2-enyl-diphosphate synthase [Proteobacteria bacterium]|nr:(E)-4-hydroxy-3-methylbut-2-enyl-diphosphate synthase [Pseudomonadota bacterium]